MKIIPKFFCDENGCYPQIAEWFKSSELASAVATKTQSDKKTL